VAHLGGNRLASAPFFEIFERPKVQAVPGFHGRVLAHKIEPFEVCVHKRFEVGVLGMKGDQVLKDLERPEFKRE
jgi:hypothetical protein